MEDANRPEIMQAPPSLLPKLEARLHNYRTYLTETKTLQDHIAMLQHPAWEIRSAAVEALGRYDPDTALEPLLEALSDENNIVRLTAISTLGHMDAHIPVDRLQRCLNDHDWQVREIAVLTLGRLGLPQTRQYVETARSDNSYEVRTAADRALQEYDRHHHQYSATPDETIGQTLRRTTPHNRTERISLFMNGTQLSPASTDQQVDLNSQEAVPALPARKRRMPLRLLLVAATAILLLAVLSAAGVEYGWWNAAFGNPNLYQTVQQRQTDQGVTVVVTKVYADEGRTVIAYDTYVANHDQNRQFFPDHYDVQGSAPQKQEPLNGVFGDGLKQGVTHFYMVLPAFQVPAGQNTVTITWDIGRMIVSQPGKNVNEPELEGHWHFSFTVPFHHTNNRQLPDPIHGELISH